MLTLVSLGCRWWQGADAPWQLLAVCYDLQAALASGSPETYRSKLPIHQDGSCNGLQHYAALGRDESGGRAVNLLPVDKPQVSDLQCGRSSTVNLHQGSSLLHYAEVPCQFANA